MVKIAFLEIFIKKTILKGLLDSLVTKHTKLPIRAHSNSCHILDFLVLKEELSGC